MLNISSFDEQGFYKFKYYGSMPTFANGTDICCGECRFSQIHPPTLSAELMIACIITGFWSGAVVTFFVQKVILSMIPQEFWYRVRFFIAFLFPCLSSICVPGAIRSDDDINSLHSKQKRDDMTDFETVIQEQSNIDCIFDDWRLQAMEFNDHDGIDETCRENVTVHTF